MKEINKALRDMNRKINLLIALSSIVLIALCVMQYYLVTTAYEYKVTQFRNEIKDKLARITNDYSDIDSTIFHKRDALYKELAQAYLREKKNKTEIKNALLQNNFKEELSHKLQKEFEHEIPDLSINFAIVLNKFIIYKNEQQKDTIFTDKSLIKNKMYGGLTSLENAFLIRNYVGTTSEIKTENTYKLLTEDTLYVAVEDWEMIILKRMTAILFFAFFSILVLISLFVIAIKALIQQKKVSDIKTDFINNITHELKTPLTTLSVSTKILERPDVKENEQLFQQVLHTINRQNNRLQNLIDQVMSNSLGFEEIELQKENLSLNSFLQTITHDFSLAHPNISITTHFHTTDITVYLDKFHLTTAITNVLENAVKYGCSNIVVNTFIQDQEIGIQIQDNGIGIAKNQQSLLFDKFYRVENGNVHNTKGLGLGLYYVDQIVKAHKGRIKLASELGKGAAFTIAIPC